MNQTIAFDDVLLIPQYSDIQSRKEIDLSSRLDEHVKLELPIISSCMDTVTESEMAVALNVAGGIGIIHRYNTIEQQVQIFKESKGTGICAIGVGDDLKDRVLCLAAAGCSMFCIDVAHGHHILVKQALEYLKSEYPDFHFMAGNVATHLGYDDLVRWGANSVRVGIGGGSICSTRIQTGHGMSTLASIKDIVERSELYKTHNRIPLIADGGIRNSGDIVKALAFGADFVMLGSLLAGHKQCPGEVMVNQDGERFKVYRGMASKEAQINWRGYTSSLEGVSSTVRYKGDVMDTLRELEINIRSGLSYSGVRTIKDLQQKFFYVQQTSAGAAESTTHILGVK